MTKKKVQKEKSHESAVTSFIKDLVITPPTDKERQIFKGETKILKYQLTNSSFHVLENIEIEALTVLKQAGHNSIPTKKIYVKHIDYPKKIEGHTTKFCNVTVNVPLDYNETIIREGQVVEWPFRVSMSVKSLKRIEEI